MINVSLIKKITVCCLAGILGFFGLQAGINEAIPAWLQKTIAAGCMALAVIAVLYIPVWQVREKKHPADSQKTLAFWQGLIIYVEAFVFFKFGLMKLFGLHMTSSLFLGDMPADSIGGYYLVDYFFGRAPAFKTMIAWIQLAGAAMLLFRKTRLLGTFLLLPVIVNIVCMDLLYNVGHVTLVALSLLAGLVYLLWQDKEKLLRFFLDTDGAMPAWHFKTQMIRQVVRVSALGFPLLILVPAIKPLANADILGKYNVTNLTINNKAIAMDLNNDSLLTAVYFDQNATCILRYNDYRHLQIGKAMYDENTKTLNVIWRYPKRDTDTTVLQFIEQGRQRILSGKLNGNTIIASLVKTDLPTEVIKK